MIGVVLFVVIVLIVAIYLLVEFKRFRHKLFAIFIIALILFTYISAALIFNGKNIDLKTIPGVINASKVYFGWLFSLFGNLKTITSYAIKMNWNDNSSISK